MSEVLYQKFFDCWSHISFAGFWAIIQYYFMEKVEVGIHVISNSLYLKTSCKKAKLKNSNIKGYIQKGSRMHILKNPFLH